MAIVKRSRQFLCVALALVALSFIGVPARATLLFYYDPETGNVSFDTAETRSGVLYAYSLSLNPSNTSLRFLPENHVRISQTFLFRSLESRISDSSLSIPISGLYTIGDILPAGLSEETWSSLLVWNRDSPHTGDLFYNDIVGPPKGNIEKRKPPAEFIYGRPDREFDNRWELVDPETLIWAESATLVYRKQSGEVLVDTSGADSGYISTIHLKSADKFLPEKYDPFIDVPLNSANEDTIFLHADAIEPGLHSLGKILESGLSSEEFETIFTEAKFWGRAGFGSGSFGLETEGLSLTLAYVEAVPEPTALTLTLAMLAALVLPSSHLATRP